MCTFMANSKFVRNFSHDFKAVACVSLPFTTASVFRKRSGFGVTLHLTLLDMRLEHVHCSVTFCSLKITHMLGPVWLCSLGVAGCSAIFITTPRNPPHTKPSLSQLLGLLMKQSESVCNWQVLITDQQLGYHLSDIPVLRDSGDLHSLFTLTMLSVTH